MAKLKHAKKGTKCPLETRLAAGKYKWCGCGETKKVPWCDGTCKGGKPVRFEMKKKATVEICTCGSTKTPPFCDGSHAACTKRVGKKHAGKKAGNRVGKKASKKKDKKKDKKQRG